MKEGFVIGIDPGTKTGFAVKTLQGQWKIVSTLKIHLAMDIVLRLHEAGENLYVIFEDARKRKWINDRYMSESRRNGLRQGAGSVKRDAAIWEDFLCDLGVPFRAEAPAKGKTKIEDAYFRRLTGWNKVSSEHARDAAMLIHAINSVNLSLHFPELRRKKTAK